MNVTEIRELNHKKLTVRVLGTFNKIIEINKNYTYDRQEIALDSVLIINV